MQNLLLALLLALCLAAPLQAADDAAVEPEKQPVELGEGVVLPREVFDQLMAREDGMQMIERMQRRAEETRQFEGVPHMILVFGAVLLFFWSAMLYYQRKHARLHRTLQLMIEKGMPLPPELLRATEQSEANESSHAVNVGAAVPPVWASNLLWGGILWITIGLAGILYLWIRHSDAWPWGIAAVVYGLGAVATALKKKPVTN